MNEELPTSPPRRPTGADSPRSRYVAPIQGPGAPVLEELGGKGASLASLSAAGLPVPPGFVVTAAAYAVSVSRDNVPGEKPTIDPEVADAIRAAYSRLGPGDPPVAVRSSATAEDLPEASFAGQQETFLNVRGAEAVLAGVIRCWDSLHTPRARAYRREHAIPEDGLAMAVVVQQMVEAQTAGVVFTVDPVSRRRDRMVINASYGLGDAIVSGTVDPDTFVLRRPSLAVSRRTLGAKAVTQSYATGGGGVAETPTPEARRGRWSLSDGEIGALARLALDVEDHYGFPQDIEWAMRDGRIFLLQSRPITTIGAAPDVDEQDHWTRAMFVEILPDAPSPVFNSVLRPVLTEMLVFTLRAWGMRPPTETPACEIFYNQPYLNIRFLREGMAGTPLKERERLVARLANPFGSFGGSSSAGSPSLAGLRLMWRMVRAARKVRGDLPAVIESFYDGLEPIAASRPADMSDTELADAVRVVTDDLIPPLIAYDFLLIASLGLVHRVIESAVDRARQPEPEAALAALLSGVTGNVTLETNKAIWRLAEMARQSEALRGALLEIDLASPVKRQGLDGLASLDGGAAFVAAFDRLLDQHGHREARMDILYPTWSEDPRPVLLFVRAYLSADHVADPETREIELVRQRETVAEDVRGALADSQKDRLIWRPLFNWAYSYNEALGGERDTMHYHVTASFPVLRRLLAEIGRRWVAAGALTAPDDVFFLERDELLGAPDARFAGEADRRRQLWEQERAGPWPIVIVAGEDVYTDDSESDEVRSAGSLLVGIGGSPGIASGPVKIVLGPEDFDKVREGDVLVAPLTNPVWTPLFPIAAAIVTDVGGVLSHGAIVAREYGVPAVVGARSATSRLKDGEWVTVDGSAGTVTSRQPEPEVET